MFYIKRILGDMRRAIEDYDMIQDGDRIAVGVSGGKDSITLLMALRQLQNFLPRKFGLEAITLTMGMGEFDVSPIKTLCERLGIRYTVEETLIGRIVFEERQEENPCSMCANLRRGALHNAAKGLGCNKVALGHHYDDVVETTLLSTFYEGRFHTFSPVTHLKRKDLYLIRPMIYTKEKDIKRFIKSNNVVTVPSPCTVNGKTKRQYIKELIEALNKDNKFVKANIFGAVKRAHIDEW